MRRDLDGSNEEIHQFKKIHGEDRIFSLIVAGEPNASSKPECDDEECFPLALRFKLGPDGELSDQPAEPIAADARPRYDGWQTPGSNSLQECWASDLTTCANANNNSATDAWHSLPPRHWLA